MKNKIAHSVKTIKHFCAAHKYGSLFAAGALSALPFIVGELFFLSYVSLFVYYFFMTGTAEKPFKKSFAYFSGFYIAEYHWFASLYPIEVYKLSKAESVIVILALWGGISCIHTVISSAVMSIMNSIAGKNLLKPFAAASLWVINEWLLGVGGFGFPWARTALAQSGFLIQIQTISLFGCFFITLVVCVCAFCAAEWAKHGSRPAAVIAVSVFVLNIIAGTVIYLVPRGCSDKLSVAIIQGNIGSDEKWEEGGAREALDVYVRLAKRAAEETGAKLIVLPESAIPYNFEYDGEIYNELSSIAREHDTVILFGALCFENGKDHNSIFAIYPDGSVSKRYDKQKLVPVIEGLPYDDTLRYTSFLSALPFFKNVDWYDGIYEPGDSGSVIEISGSVSVAPAVCYDSVFPSVVRESVKNGASLISIVTNDSWYHKGSEIYQHKNIAKLRSVENGRYAVRAANTGISCIIDDKGREATVSKPMTECMIYAEIEIINGKTLYTIVGDVPLYASFVFVFALVFKKIIKKINKKKNNLPAN